VRARIVLLCADGRLNGDVATELGTSIQMVGRWRRRFVQGRLSGLKNLS
jgi:transposase